MRVRIGSKQLAHPRVEKKMRIKQFSVRELFGVFNHVIPMKMEDRITIIHGPNGFGKTAILKLIDGLFNSRYSEIRNMPFSEFNVVFDDESIIEVKKRVGPKQEGTAVTSPIRIIVTYTKSGSKPESFQLGRLSKVSEVGIPIHLFEEFIPELERVGPQSWRFIPTEELLSLDDVIERFGYLLPINASNIEADPQWFKDLINSVDIRFIQTQRLLTVARSARSNKTRSIPMKEVVTEYCTELARAIQGKLSEYATLSQSLDRTFPLRLVKEEVPEDSSFETLRNQLGALEEKRNRLTAAGLLDKEKDVDFQVPSTMDERTKGVLSVYVKDVQEKLSIFDEMAAKIDLFKKIISERFKYKGISISKESGVSFTTIDGAPLSPTSLSSGEQHELVLLYEFLFKVRPNSLILIDEPEISLHIAWQEQFLKDLQQITELASFDVLIATHSPQLIYDRWDLTVELKGPAENGSGSNRDMVEQSAAIASESSSK